MVKGYKTSRPIIGPWKDYKYGGSLPSFSSHSEKSKLWSETMWCGKAFDVIVDYLRYKPSSYPVVWDVGEGHGFV